MERRRLAVTAATVLLIGLAVASLYTMSVMEPEQLSQLRQQFSGEHGDNPQGDRFDNEFVHKHAHLYFFTDGERRELTEAYIERDHGLHFHHDDGIIHLEGRDANLSTALETLNITVNDTCVHYGLDDETFCGEDDTELRFVLNNETVDREEWLNHTIRQSDNIILYHGDTETAIPEEYFESLPDGYAPGYDRL